MGFNSNKSRKILFRVYNLERLLKHNLITNSLKINIKNP